MTIKQAPCSGQLVFVLTFDSNEPKRHIGGVDSILVMCVKCYKQWIELYMHKRAV
jgi:hypothetical protein